MTTAPTTLLTPADLAARLKLTEAQVLDLRRKHNWPCVQFSRKTIRFSVDQANQIVARHAAEPTQPAETVTAIEGQTAASRRRRSA